MKATINVRKGDTWKAGSHYFHCGENDSGQEPVGTHTEIMQVANGNSVVVVSDAALLEQCQQDGRVCFFFEPDPQKLSSVLEKFVDQFGLMTTCLKSPVEAEEEAKKAADLEKKAAKGKKDGDVQG